MYCNSESTTILIALTSKRTVSKRQHGNIYCGVSCFMMYCNLENTTILIVLISKRTVSKRQHGNRYCGVSCFMMYCNLEKNYNINCLRPNNGKVIACNNSYTVNYLSLPEINNRRIWSQGNILDLSCEST
jgi:hypothetical protein